MADVTAKHGRNVCWSALSRGLLAWCGVAAMTGRPCPAFGKDSAAMATPP